MIATDHETATASIESNIDGGTRLTIDVPFGVKRLELRDDGGRPEWSLAIGEAMPNGEIEELVTLGRSGKYEEAVSRLEALRTRQAVQGRGQTDAAIARVMLDLGRVDRAEPAFRASIAAAKAEGRTSDVVRDSAALVWALAMLEQRFADARVVLQDMEAAGAIPGRQGLDRLPRGPVGGADR